MMVNGKVGSLVIEEQKHLQEYGGPPLQFYSKTIRSGKLGRLLGKFRKQEVIDFEKVKMFAADLEIYDEELLFDSYLPQLEKIGSIDIHKDSSGKIFKIEENLGTEAEILKITGELWNASSPSELEQSSLDLITLLTKFPRTKGDIIGEIGNLGYSNPQFSLELAATCDIIQEHSIPGINEPVYHTPYYARENTTKMIHAIKGLKSDEIDQLGKFLDKVDNYQAMPISQISEISGETLLKCEQTGIIDISNVESVNGHSEKFVFTPAMWNPFGKSTIFDEQEHVRALLSCVRFGQISPSKIEGHLYPIKYPDKYLAALLRRKKIRESSMIGLDYLILAKEGIVNIIPSATREGYYEMQLVKDDIAERAHRIVSSGRDISLDGAQSDTFPMSDAINFDNPIRDRIKTSVKFKKSPHSRSGLMKEHLLEIIRGER